MATNKFVVGKALQRLKPKHWLAIGLSLIIIIVALIVISASLFSHRSPSTADGDTMKQVVLRAFGANHQLVLLPHANDPSVKPTTADIATTRSHAHDVVTTLYDPSYQIGRDTTNQIDSTLTAESHGYERVLDAAVTDIDWRDLTLVDDNTASVTIAATESYRVTYTDMNGKQTLFTYKQGRVDVYTLTKVANSWLITNVTIDSDASNKLPVNQHTAPKKS